MKRMITACLILAALRFGIAWAGPVEDGYNAFNQKDFQTALRNFQPLLASNNPIAQFFIGYMAKEGMGMEKNPALALELLRKSATQNYAGAQYQLGVMYRTGTIVEKNEAEAVKWFTYALKQCNQSAYGQLREMAGLGNSLAIASIQNNQQCVNERFQHPFNALAYPTANPELDGSSDQIAAASKAWKNLASELYQAWYFKPASIQRVNDRISADFLYQLGSPAHAQQQGFKSKSLTLLFDCDNALNDQFVVAGERKYSNDFATGNLLSETKLNTSVSFANEKSIFAGYKDVCATYWVDYYKANPPKLPTIEKVAVSTEFKYVPALAPWQINEWIIARSFNLADLDVMRYLYAFMYTIHKNVELEPQGPYADLKMPMYREFIRYKAQIDAAFANADLTIAKLGASIGISSEKFRLAADIRGVAKEGFFEPSEAMLIEGNKAAIEYLTHPGTAIKRTASTQPAVELVPQYFFDYYSGWYPEYFKARTPQMVKIAGQVDNAIASGNKGVLARPDGVQNIVVDPQLKAAIESLPQDFPYYAIISCDSDSKTMLWLESCFIGNAASKIPDLLLDTGGRLSKVNVHEFRRMIGKDTRYGTVFGLGKSFKFVATNNPHNPKQAPNMHLNLLVYQRSNNQVLYIKQVGLNEEISISN